MYDPNLAFFFSEEDDHQDWIKTWLGSECCLPESMLEIHGISLLPSLTQDSGF
jgi:hypothetical protein